VVAFLVGRPGTRSDPTSTTPPTQSQNALGPGAVVAPGLPTISAALASGSSSVTFTWTYDAPTTGDVSRWWRVGPGKGPTSGSLPAGATSIAMPVTGENKVCIKVQVVRSGHGGPTAQGCWVR